MLTAYDMLIKLIDLKEKSGQLNEDYVNYLLSLMNLFVAMKQITQEQYEEIYVRLESIINPINKVEDENSSIENSNDENSNVI